MPHPSHDRLGPIEYALAVNSVLHEPTPTVATMSLSELQQRIANTPDVMLVMAMDRRRFEAAHIEGSIDLESFVELAPTLASDTEIIVYCTDPACAASRIGAAMIAEAGFTNVHRFPGGLSTWVNAGLPLAERDRAA